MNSKIDEVEKNLSTVYKNSKNVEVTFSSNFTANVMADVRLANVKMVRQETVAWRAGWMTFAAAALVMVYFGMTFEQTSMTDDLLSTVYSDDSVAIFDSSDLSDF